MLDLYLRNLLIPQNQRILGGFNIKLPVSFMVACLVFTIFSSAQAEEFALGPAKIYLDMIFVPEPHLDMGEPYADLHYTWNGPLNCTVYPANIEHYREAQIQFHQLAEPAAIDLSMIQEVLYDSDLLPIGWSTKVSNLSIAGHRGVLVNATRPQGITVRMAGFSPDGDDGRGRFICLLRSDLRWSCTQALLESMRVNIKH
jgi:hypothetical protein